MILHYFYDPLCGWCYGFSPVIRQFFENHKDEFIVEVTSGGMVKGQYEKPISDMADFLRGAFKQVENTTGVEFGQGFLDRIDEGSTILSSVPGSIALSVFKTFNTEKDIYFAADIQKAIYFKGIDPSDMEQYAEIASQYNVDTNEFLARAKKDEYRKLAYDDFSVTQQYGVKGYPTSVLEYKDEFFLLHRGYTKIENLEKTYQSILHSHQ